jgi:hypothetical protein
MRIRMTMLLVCALVPHVAAAQGEPQPRWLVDNPTAGLLPKGSFAVDVRLYDENGILAQLEVGLLERAGIGFSFGGQRLVGNQEAKWNPRLEFMGRVRVIEEGYSVPAVAVGYQSQGYGAFDKELDRYTTKSKGFYAVLSKNFGSSVGDAGLHAGVNRSREDADGDKDFSGFLGVDKQVGKSITLLAEYDFALNDNEDNTLGSGRGLMNVGVRWAASKQLSLEVDFKNVFRDGHRNPNPDREIRLLYYEKF